MNELWIVGQHKHTTNSGLVWEFQGVFDSEEKAIAACRNERYWVAEVELNKEICDEPQKFKNAYYPFKAKA